MLSAAPIIRMVGRLVGLACVTMLFAAPPVGGAFESPPDCPKDVSICLRSTRVGRVDLKTGIAELEGDVQGYLRAQNLKFRADKLKAFRDKNNEWVRLVLDRNVRINQPDTVATADHSVLTRDKAVLSGNSRAERPPYLIEGHEIEMDDITRTITVKGTPENPARIEYQTADKDTGEERSADVGNVLPPASAGDGEQAPEIIFIQALQAVIDSERDEIVLTGQVLIDRPLMNWRMRASTAHLRFNGQRQLKDFRAEGGVKIEQPERTLRSDIALSRDNNETILLIGNARVEQEGAFQVSSDRLEVYTDTTKGVVQSQDKDRPIKLAINITPNNKKQNTYMLDDTNLQTLAGKGVPFDTLAKLKRLRGRGYAERKKFEAALRGVLSETEMEQFMEAVIAHAR